MLTVEQWPIDKLIPYARNPRKNDEQVDRMVSAIKEFGFRIPIIARSDGSVVDGHLRLKAAHKLGLKDVPVALADELTPAQVKAFRLLANKSANWAEWDISMLAGEFKDLAESGYDLDLTGFNLVEIGDVVESLDINFSGESAKGIKTDSFGGNKVRVKVCLPADIVEIFEYAIDKTGEFNRAEAVRKICEAYLEKR